MSQCSLTRSSCGEPKSQHHNPKVLHMCDWADEGLLLAASFGKNNKRVSNADGPQTPIFVLPRKPHGLISAAEALNAIKTSPSHIFNRDGPSLLKVHENKQNIPIGGGHFSEVLRSCKVGGPRNVLNCRRLLQRHTATMGMPMSSHILASPVATTEGSNDNYADISDEYDPKSKDSALQVLYEDRVQNSSRKLESNCDKSNDSMQESGYKSYNSCTTTLGLSQEQHVYLADVESIIGKDINNANVEMKKEELLPSLVEHTINRVPEKEPKTCNIPVASHCNKLQRNGPSGVESMTVSAAVQGPSEEISKLILDLIGPNSRLGHLDDSLNYVKEHLTQIHHDINDFKDNCWKKIESKVSHSEFTDTTAILRAKITYLERKMFNENRLMRQDLRMLRDRLNHIENESACSFKNFPIWPFVAFVGAYSIITFGHR